MRIVTKMDIMLTKLYHKFYGCEIDDHPFLSFFDNTLIRSKKSIKYEI